MKKLLTLIVILAIWSSTPGASAAGSARQGVVSDRFELVWELDGQDLLLAVDTDLPDEAELSVSVRRTYFEVGNEVAYSRDYFSELEPVARWRQPRRIILDADAWKADLSAHQGRMASFGADMAFDVDRIEDDVNIRAVLHLNQDDPRFGGRGNPNLSGNAVTVQASRRLIEAEASFTFPLGGLPPERSNRVAHDGLVVGESYRFSGKVPLMPELDPADPIAAIRRVIEITPGSVVRVVETADQRGTPWYGVMLARSESTTGWINSTALIGLEIERIQ